MPRSRCPSAKGKLLGRASRPEVRRVALELTRAIVGREACHERGQQRIDCRLRQRHDMLVERANRRGRVARGRDARGQRGEFWPRREDRGDVPRLTEPVEQPERRQGHLGLGLVVVVSVRAPRAVEGHAGSLLPREARFGLRLGRVGLDREHLRDVQHLQQERQPPESASHRCPEEEIGGARDEQVERALTGLGDDDGRCERVRADPPLGSRLPGWEGKPRQLPQVGPATPRVGLDPGPEDEWLWRCRDEPDHPVGGAGVLSV